MPPTLEMTRRTLLRTGGAALAGGLLAATTRRANASPLGLPLGLQLYSVREQMAADFDGTLRKIAALGYKDVESAGYFGRNAQQVKKSMADAGLNLVSAHHPLVDLLKSADEIIAFEQQAGAKFLICAFPWFRNPSRLKDTSFATIIRSYTVDDFRYSAEQFNLLGAKVKQAGMQFGYHNHTMEFAPQQGIVPYDELMRLTDPALVTFEMDCGWVTVGGADPVDLLRRYPTRITMLHVKDFARTSKPASVVDPPPSAELGRGSVDFKRIFTAAKSGHIQHYFVEQETFDMPPFDALRIDADYVRSLPA